MNTRRLLIVALFSTLLLLSLLLSGCGPVRDILVGALRDQVEGEVEPSDIGSQAATEADLPTESTDAAGGSTGGASLPAGFPSQVPLLAGNVIMAQHEKDENDEWFIVNFDSLTETDQDAYLARLSAAGWEYSNITAFDGGWIISGSYRSEYVLQASVFTEEKAGVLVVTTDTDAY